MFDTVTRYDFIEWFRTADETSSPRKGQFTDEGLDALFDHLEEYEENTGEKIEFDPIAICCDYTEYKNIEEYKENYALGNNINEIRELTTVIETKNKGFIIQNY